MTVIQHNIQFCSNGKNRSWEMIKNGGPFFCIWRLVEKYDCASRNSGKIWVHFFNMNVWNMRSINKLLITNLTVVHAFKSHNKRGSYDVLKTKPTFFSIQKTCVFTAIRPVCKKSLWQFYFDGKNIPEHCRKKCTSKKMSAILAGAVVFLN